ncbi:DegT/DnrJ/EryC1/StrS family aminotransferase [Aliarcobacter cryaerophilus]|uniref:DegT/DnrJ/EryC1/StrS family aminotransferase n=1 Tax=Aliarcobacter cryaerophilus TaxID=28198 RepID=UPI003BB16508
MKMNIPITKTIFGDEEKEAIVKPLETGWVVQGPNVAKFQNMFADFTGSKYAHAASNCTTALHLGLEAMGITKGDKVIVPSFTYVASANAVEYTGAEVVFCDIDLKTFNIDVQKLDKLLSECVSGECEGKVAIMPVNLFGLCANMPEIINLAQKYSHSNSHPHKIRIIEDSACGFDGWIGDKHSGTFGDCGCFSFHPRKSICTGEGGMLITDDEDIANKVSQLKDHGASKSDLQRHKEKGGSLLPDFTMRGYNYRMTDMQGALGVCQMDRKEYIMNGRREVASKYDIVLKDISQLLTPYIPENYKHGYQSYVCIFTDGEDISNLTKEQIDRINIKRNIFMEKLEEMTIATRQGTHAVHTLGYYKNKNNFKDEDFLMSYAADRLSIALPLYAGMTNEEFDYVIQNIKNALNV